MSCKQNVVLRPIIKVVCRFSNRNYGYVVKLIILGCSEAGFSTFNKESVMKHNIDYFYLVMDTADHRLMSNL